MAALIAFAVVALLLVLAARADAAPTALPDGSLPSTDELDGAKPARDADDLSFAGADLVLVPSSSKDEAGVIAADVAAVATSAPPLRELVAAAYRAAGIDRDSDPTWGWRARSRWSALIPLLSLRAGNTSSWRDVDDPGVVTVNRGATFSVGAPWRLDELVYDPNELRFETFELALRRERRKVASITTHLYFRWLRAETPAGSVVRAAELAAQLDALTDGWFSEHRTPPNR